MQPLLTQNKGNVHCPSHFFKHLCPAVQQHWNTAHGTSRDVPSGCLYRHSSEHNQPPGFSWISAGPEKILWWECVVPRHCIHVDEEHLLLNLGHLLCCSSPHPLCQTQAGNSSLGGGFLLSPYFSLSKHFCPTFETSIWWCLALKLFCKCLHSSNFLGLGMKLLKRRQSHPRALQGLCTRMRGITPIMADDLSAT